MNMEAMIDKYFRPGRLPNIWCPGCGNGVVTGTIVKAVAKLDLDKDKVAVISGIGCSSRASGYLDFNTVHSAHGRALPVATGVQLADPGLTVIVVTGDGDATSDRRQPPDPRCPPQHRYDRRTLQQQYLRYDRRPVFAFDTDRFQSDDGSLCDDRTGLQRSRAGQSGRRYLCCPRHHFPCPDPGRPDRQGYRTQRLQPDRSCYCLPHLLRTPE